MSASCLQPASQWRHKFCCLNIDSASYSEISVFVQYTVIKWRILYSHCIVVFALPTVDVKENITEDRNIFMGKIIISMKEYFDAELVQSKFALLLPH